jgi:hypothetical protein
MEMKVAASEPVEGNIRRPGFVMGNSASINNNNNRLGVEITDVQKM